MPLTTAGRNDAAGGVTGGITHVSAMSDLGTTESSTARQAVAWTAPASGVADNSGAISIAMAVGTSAQVVGLHSALTAGTLKGWAGIGANLKKGVGVADTLANDIIRSNGHGLVNTNRVFFWAPAGETLPTGLSATVLYFVVGATTDGFQVSLTSGGAAVDITGLGDVNFSQTIPEAFSNAGNLQIAIGALDIDATFA